jgi:hypothetical protein
MTQTYSEIAKELRNQFEFRTWPPCDSCHQGKTERYVFTARALGMGDEDRGVSPPNHEELSDIIHAAEMSDDFAYLFAVEALDAICDAEPEDESALDDVETEPPCYTRELMAFIADSDRNAAYIQAAIDEYGAPSRGHWTALLTMAYDLAMREVLSEIKELVKKIHDGQDEGDSLT